MTVPLVAGLLPCVLLVISYGITKLMVRPPKKRIWQCVGGIFLILLGAISILFGGIAAILAVFNPTAVGLGTSLDPNEDARREIGIMCVLFGGMAMMAAGAFSGYIGYYLLHLRHLP